METESSQAPIGVFDSGVGGLSVLRAILLELPDKPIIYLADQAHVPYGPRSLAEVRSFSETISRYLINQGCKLVVVACNTASAAALYSLRQTFPDTPFIGMEPAVKPAAEITRTRAVGVLATPATFQGVLYASVVERFANGVQIYQDTCPGLVIQIESGHLDSMETREILEKALRPMLKQGIDTVVLGCTHYPFVIPLIQHITGPFIRVIDPAPAIARQVRRILAQKGDSQSRSRDYTSPTLPVQIISTGDPQNLEWLLQKLLGVDWPVKRVDWKDLTNPVSD